MHQHAASTPQASRACNPGVRELHDTWPEIMHLESMHSWAAVLHLLEIGLFAAESSPIANQLRCSTSTLPGPRLWLHFASLVAFTPSIHDCAEGGPVSPLCVAAELL